MSKAWTLAKRPDGMPRDENFALIETPDAPLEQGQLRIANSWLSVDPYMRGRMVDRKSYVPPFQLGEPMQGGAVGRVTESRHKDFTEGDLVLHMGGWRDMAIVDDALMPRKIPETGMDDQLWLSVMGLTGMTAWFGLLHVAEAREGDTVFVSAAAGAVGSVVVQLAKTRGMTVIGSAGSDEKCAWVRELGADSCINYKNGPVYEQLRKAAPNGISVYFDNVGGDHLDAALACARPFARFTICGMIEVYNDFEKGAEMAMRFMPSIIGNRINLRGFIASDYLEHMPEFLGGMGELVASGKVQARATVHEGLEAAPKAFMGLFEGGNIGKMLVRL